MKRLRELVDVSKLREYIPEALEKVKATQCPAKYGDVLYVFDVISPGWMEEEQGRDIAGKLEVPEDEILEATLRLSLEVDAACADLLWPDMALSFGWAENGDYGLLLVATGGDDAE